MAKFCYDRSDKSTRQSTLKDECQATAFNPESTTVDNLV